MTVTVELVKPLVQEGIWIASNSSLEGNRVTDRS